MEAGHLRVGENLVLINGSQTSVASIAPRGPPERVYNLEVHGEHVYFVSDVGILVHNQCASKLRRSMNDAGVYGDPGTVPHHLVSRNDRRAATAISILRRHNIDPDSHWNGVFLPVKGSSARGAIHNNLHTNNYYKTLTDRLKTADAQGGRAQVLRELQRIRSELVDGTYPSLLNRNINF